MVISGNFRFCPLTSFLTFVFFLIFQGGGNIGQAMGYSVELNCQVEAFPRPTITWVHEGIQLSTNQVRFFLEKKIYTVSVMNRLLKECICGNYSECLHGTFNNYWKSYTCFSRIH